MSLGVSVFDIEIILAFCSTFKFIPFQGFKCCAGGKKKVNADNEMYISYYSRWRISGASQICRTNTQIKCMKTGTLFEYSLRSMYHVLERNWIARVPCTYHHYIRANCATTAQERLWHSPLSHTHLTSTVPPITIGRNNSARSCIPIVAEATRKKNTREKFATGLTLGLLCVDPGAIFPLT